MASQETSSSLKLTPAQKQVVDEYVEVRQRMLQWRPQVNPDAQRFQELEDLILSWCAKKPATKRLILEGSTHVVPVSPCENKRVVINLPGLLKKLGSTKFVAIAKVTLKAIERVIPKEQRKLYIRESRNGPREIGEPSLKEAA